MGKDWMAKKIKNLIFSGSLERKDINKIVKELGKGTFVGGFPKLVNRKA